MAHMLCALVIGFIGSSYPRIIDIRPRNGSVKGPKSGKPNRLCHSPSCSHPTDFFKVIRGHKEPKSHNFQTSIFPLCLPLKIYIGLIGFF
ncbi:hypothetical protein GDO81_016974 [Engystomops pustulosus]|uniref:Secreted protein n=1 Tax=Engystomops pustulosus TaxID=76066 RepID=A0AAV7AC54_ENGPU|nr:hypothetical protein GDO81_016974 [Engystomops pustulosus]